MSSSNKGVEKLGRRIKYKELIEKGTKVGETLENQHVLDTFNHIVDIIDKCENVSTGFAREGKIENTNDYLLDAQVIKMSHDLISNTTEKMTNSEFREDEYSTAISEILSSDNAHKLVEIAIMCSKTVQFQLSMLGTFDLDAAPREPKIKKTRQAQKKDFGQKKCPENVKQIVKSDKGAEKINIMREEIQRVCTERQSDTLPYFEVVINPRSFMKSVDAAFQIAFLVRDGNLGLKRINDEPYVYLTRAEPTHNKSQRGGDEQTVQTVMSINPALWKEETIKYKLKTPLLNLDQESNDASIMESSSDDD